MLSLTLASWVGQVWFGLVGFGFLFGWLFLDQGVHRGKAGTGHQEGQKQEDKLCNSRRQKGGGGKKGDVSTLVEWTT